MVEREKEREGTPGEEKEKEKEKKEEKKDQRLLLGVVVVVYCCVYLFFIYSIQGHDYTVTKEDVHSIVPSHLTNNQQREKLTKDQIGITEFFGDTSCTWQLPPDHTPTALLFAAPGCHHTSFDWWETSSSCPQCSSLPEERKIVKEALSRNWAILVCSPRELCWRKNDIHRVVPAIQEFQTRNHLEKKPLYAFGASSGGYFMYFLTRAIKLSGIIVQIMVLGEDQLWDNSLNYVHPPVFFSSMSRDAQIKRAVEIQAAGWEEQGVNVMLNEMNPLPIDEFFFSKRIQNVPKKTSKEIHKLLKKEKLLNEKNYLLNDPRDSLSLFREGLQGIVEKNGLSDPVLPDKSPILQELNVAYCQHEISSDPIPEAFDWLITQKK